MTSQIPSSPFANRSSDLGFSTPAREESPFDVGTPVSESQHMPEPSQQAQKQERISEAEWQKAIKERPKLIQTKARAREGQSRVQKAKRERSVKFEDDDDEVEQRIQLSKKRKQNTHLEVDANEAKEAQLHKRQEQDISSKENNGMDEESYHKKSPRMFHIGVPEDVRSITLSIKFEA
ncbi:hypothetical protein AGABI1DRAFT_91152 [Agaricus bisporus var. burnettii JB137-S8]|uniref:Uncharacterized protein n=1 Tax=Agaricus bisporus var. burnettii (strain JB137-S8 / ATCC MYA-4627 / FGSC 10392) TaxID=597362 RepID=K5VZ40_AGABU|nr:uncharacterized protein AGABI1DRAFT_91152 [Agaricus bisporus var. burnettii JB137-S8]EKM79779.1 hypothetical protein AGABI1DRAFT_91152 [Agaricus bisporus var. burnettii JB137-S8]